ncbi:putative ABC-type peptide transport system, periplasmic component [Thiomonas arsenitoxydans]|uniref:ABC-type peptide transport system, periplasmic component n=2 Tax=Thiomonas arsenitoxydans (strain DSM 22701 / CIP 110005 / 3As) TaxID=426114 RepID=A0ABM9T5J4_THIA3|nr:putative ABC-type peptide transport system, periplasmic component [Thiomonas arsenitoxydans]CQR33302.1 putative ABC-type peptide transport system, periplasmic component [Thiomonas arsenitoxydans]CQR33656.1 putative ABC-type peptide transport system, periplasmic component [Thiomonas arsenitoxydans]CQR40051.1 putative ABC-type peptide transport system, periplasmic component [Thiomonas arsenitoxydans]
MQNSRMAHALSRPLSPARRRLLQSLPLGLFPFGAAWASQREQQAEQPAYALYDQPKYPPGFTHFDYVNPQAPVGGSLVLTPPTVGGSFDKLNPFTLKGNAAPGLNTLVFETLMTASWDEPNTVYGLLADDIAVAADGLSVQFHLNPLARFSNGDSVTAHDVAYSYNTLVSSAAAPQFASIYADVADVAALDERQVRFTFKRRNHELPILLAGLPVFSPKWAGQRAFNEVIDTPIASGPYRIARTSQQRDITYVRRSDYWGWHLPTRRGQFNFSEVSYKLYLDGTARLEAFKAGEYDLLQEFIARNWARQYRGPKFDSGALKKLELPNHNPAGFQGFVVNLRRPQFQDVRVRQALALALDFQWLNRMLFYGAYKRIEGYFANSPFDAHGAPGPDELALLEPLRAQLPPEVFGVLPRMPSTAPPNSLRGNLLKARALLEQAGWHWRDGALRNAKGQALVIDYLDSQGSMSRIISVYSQALQRLGITLNYRLVDFALYQQRMDTFDFDMTTIRYGGSTSPGNELFDRFGSRAASVQGSDNVWGLRDPAVDALIERVVAATSMQALQTACRALDRVLVCGWYSVPQWYSDTFRVAIAAHKFSWPKTLPLYYQPEGWAVQCWWANAKSASGAPT